MSRASEMHPEVEGVLGQLEELGIPPLSSLSVEGSRELLNELFVTDAEPEPVAQVRNLSIPSREGQVPIRIYVPDETPPFPTLVYFHGGGWVLGTLETHDPVCRAITNEAGCCVVSVDYRLAPEHKFPTPVYDCYNATKWVTEHAEILDADPDAIAVGGDSAGGNLAASIALMARNRDGPSIAYQLLVYPVTNHSFETDSYEENAEGYLLTKKDMVWFWDLYLRDETDGQNLYASPLLAGDLSGLPPATVLTCGFDPLRDEGMEYAEALENDGVNTELRHYDDVIHGTFQMLVEPELEPARTMMSDACDDLRANLG